MNANLMTNKIEMTKTEAVAAGKFDSDKFKELKSLREMFPSFEIAIVKHSTKKADRFKGLDYNYMKSYIERNQPDLMAEFYTLRGLDADGTKMEIAAASTYGEIKMWFLTKFPEIERMNDTVSEIIKMARETRKTQKKTA
jgi:hypothetical protein